jgi:hypothetical protein
MNVDRQNKLEAQASIHNAMKKFRADSYVKQPTDRVGLNEYDKLSRLQIDQGVVALVLECNLSGGSVGDIDLYTLIRNYLWHPEARTEINAIVKRIEVKGRALPFLGWQKENIMQLFSLQWN